MTAADRPIDEANRLIRGFSARRDRREERRRRLRSEPGYGVRTGAGQSLARDFVRGSERDGVSGVFANRSARRRDMFSRTAIASAAYSARAFAPSSAASRCRSRRASAAGLTGFPLMPLI